MFTFTLVMLENLIWASTTLTDLFCDDSWLIDCYFLIVFQNVAIYLHMPMWALCSLILQLLVPGVNVKLAVKGCSCLTKTTASREVVRIGSYFSVITKLLQRQKPSVVDSVPWVMRNRFLDVVEVYQRLAAEPLAQCHLHSPWQKHLPWILIAVSWFWVLHLQQENLRHFSSSLL